MNIAPESVWVDIPGELMTVLEASLQIECTTNGAFDIGVGKCVEAWGFGPASPDHASDLSKTRLAVAQGAEIA